MSNSEHTAVASWDPDDFPFNSQDSDQMAAVHRILPQEYWLAVDLRSGAERVRLMKYEGER